MQAAIIALVMEGIGFALFPGAMAQALAEMSRLPPGSLRGLGVAALAVSIFLAVLLRILR